MKRCCLIFEIGSLQKTIYPLVETTTIGRGSDNSISLADPTISRNHAKIGFQNGAWVLEDLGSANGIILGGKRVNNAALRSGDAFRIGPVTFLVVEKEVGQKSDNFFDTLEILSGAIEEDDLSSGQVRDEGWAKRLSDAIAAIPFFSLAEKRERKKLADTASLHVINAGDIIIREGDPGRSIYIVLDGRVRVFIRDHRGEDLELAVLGVGEFFGEMSFLSGNPRSSYVAAIENCLLIELSFSSMRNMVRQVPGVKKILQEYYQERLKDSQEKRAKVGMEERRRYPRLKEPLKVNILKFSQTGVKDESRVEAVSQNISISGILMVVPGGIPDKAHRDGQVRMEIELPEPHGKVRTSGKISRIQSHPEEQGMTQVAVEFVEMSAEDSNRLTAYINGEDYTNL